MIHTCEVCRLQRHNDSKLILYENDDWVVVLRADDQEYLGKSVVSCKKHVANLADITDAEWRSFAACNRWFEQHVSAAFNPANYNWQCLMNLGAAVGVTHVHWHVTPRYRTPVEFGGLVFADRRWPKPVRPTEDHRSIDMSLAYDVSEKIRRADPRVAL